MIRNDFILKLIEQFVQAIARMIKIDYEKETEKFLVVFNELLKSYFKISAEDLDELMEPDEYRDEILLDEKMKNAQLQLFTHAGLAYLIKSETGKAAQCLEIIERIQSSNTALFEFPNQEQQELNQKIEELKLGLSRV